MKNQATRDLKRCVSKRFVENFKLCSIGAIVFTAFMYILSIILYKVEHPLLAAGAVYYFISIIAMTVVIIVNRKLKRGIINFIKRFLIMSVIAPLILFVVAITLICVIGFPLMVSIATGCIYIFLCSNNGTVEIMLIVMFVSGVISFAFAMALDDCLKMIKWLNGISDSILDLVILEDDDSL